MNNGPTDAFHLTCPECNAAIDLVPDTRTDPSLEALKEARELLSDIRACRKPPETVETVHGGAIDVGAGWSISGLTALLPRIDSILGSKGGERG